MASRKTEIIDDNDLMYESYAGYYNQIFINVYRHTGGMFPFWRAVAHFSPNDTITITAETYDGASTAIRVAIDERIAEHNGTLRSLHNWLSV